MRLRALLALSLALIFTGIGHAQGFAVVGSAQVSVGGAVRTVPGATITVCAYLANNSHLPCINLVSIYSDIGLTVPLANPFLADSNGNYTYFVAPGNYTETTTGTGVNGMSLSRTVAAEGPAGATGPAGPAGTLEPFPGPSPWIDITAMTPAPCQYSFDEELYPSSIGTITSGSHTLHVSTDPSGIGVQVGCGIMIHGVGAASTETAPSAVTITNHNGTGSTHYKYQFVAIDSLHGTSAASTVATTTTGVATLSKFQYNYVTATVDSTAIAIMVYGDKGLGGALSCLGVTRAIGFRADNSIIAAFEDMGFYTAGQEPCPIWAPATPPSAVGKQTFFSTITAMDSSTITLADAATSTASTNTLYHTDNTAAMLAALTAQCNARTDSSGVTFPRILIPPGSNYSLAYMPVSPCGTWNIESYGALWMSDGLGFDVPTAALWLGRGAQEPLSPGGNGFASLVAGTLDSGADAPTVDDVVVFLNGTNGIHMDGIAVAKAFNGITLVNSGDVDLEHFYASVAGGAEGCGLRIVGLNIGPNTYSTGVLNSISDTLGVGNICYDGSVGGGAGSLGSGNDKFKDINVNGHGWFYATCPMSCSTANAYSLFNVEFNGGLTEDQADLFPNLLDPGTSTEGGTFGIQGFSMLNVDSDNDPNAGPCWSVMNPPSRSGGNIDTLYINNSFCGAATGSVDVTGTPDLQAPEITTLFEGVNCVDGSNGKWGALIAPTQQGGSGWGLVRARLGGSCIGARGAGFQNGVGIYQRGDAGNPDFNFVTLIPPPEFSGSSTTTGTLSGTFYYRASSVDCSGRESQAGPETKATASSQGIVLNYTIGDGQLVGACNVNIYRGTSSGGENLLLAAASPVTTSLTTFTDTGSLTTSSATPPAFSQAFESVLAENKNTLSYLLASNTGNLYQKRMAFGCATDPGLSAAIKWIFCGRIQIKSGLIEPLVTESSTYTLSNDDAWVNVSGTTTVTAPHANTGQIWHVFNSGSNTVTLVADSGNVNNESSVSLAPNAGFVVTCDGTNCFALGTGLKWRGTASLGTTLIASTACATTVTVSAPGVISSDVIEITQNADITGIVGFQPLTTGSLRIDRWPTTDTINVKVCNPTASSITPGSVVVLNLEVPR